MMSSTFATGSVQRVSLKATSAKATRARCAEELVLLSAIMISDAPAAGSCEGISDAARPYPLHAILRLN